MLTRQDAARSISVDRAGGPGLLGEARRRLLLPPATHSSPGRGASLRTVPRVPGLFRPSSDICIRGGLRLIKTWRREASRANV